MSRLVGRSWSGVGSSGPAATGNVLADWPCIWDRSSGTSAAVRPSVLTGNQTRVSATPRVSGVSMAGST